MNTQEKMNQYTQYLIQKELAENTRAVYLRQARLFLDFMAGREITKKETIAYKQQLITEGKSPSLAFRSTGRQWRSGLKRQDA